MDHGTVECSSCPRSSHGNIAGFRYMCLDCPKKNYCSSCESYNHLGHLVIRFAPTDNIERHIFLDKIVRLRSQSKDDLLSVGNNYNATCDNCKVNPIQDLLYKCVNCPNLDFCQRCEKQHTHPTEDNNLVVRIPNPHYLNRFDFDFWLEIIKVQNESFEQETSAFQPPKEKTCSGSKPQTNRNACGKAIQDCAICFDKPSEMILLDCGHLCICSQCVDVFKRLSKKCPICRSTFKSVHRAFF